MEEALDPDDRLGIKGKGGKEERGPTMFGQSPLRCYDDGNRVTF